VHALGADGRKAGAAVAQVEVGAGLGRIVISEIEAPIILVDLV
jgi:hypothetical protein